MRSHSLPTPLSRTRAWTAAGLIATLVLATGAAAAQAPVSGVGRLPGSNEAAVEQAYDSLDWTGRPLTPQTLRKEAAAARAEGRRSCAARFTGADRKACLQTVEEDHQAMLSRLKMRTANR